MHCFFSQSNYVATIYRPYRENAYIFCNLSRSIDLYFRFRPYLRRRAWYICRASELLRCLAAMREQYAAIARGDDTEMPLRYCRITKYCGAITYRWFRGALLLAAHKDDASLTDMRDLATHSYTPDFCCYSIATTRLDEHAAQLFMLTCKLRRCKNIML